MGTLEMGSSCYCHLLRALDLIDYKKRCLEYLSRRAPHIKWALFSLEALAAECKVITDRNGLEYDSYPLDIFLKELPVSLPFEMLTVSLMTKLKYLYYKKKLLSLVRYNFLREYIEVVKRNLQLCHGASETIAVIRKFVRLCNSIHLQPEISAQDIYQYELMAELLNLCYSRNIQDSQLVVDLLKMTIDRHAAELFGVSDVSHPEYPGGFLKYILEHARIAKFDIGLYCRSHPHTMWEYSSSFSVVNAVSFGNVERTLSLLQYGVEVFPESEVRKCGHGFPYIPEIIPPSHLLILHMMSSIRSRNFFIYNANPDQGNVMRALAEDQKKCFRLVWQSIPTQFVKQSQLGMSITAEYFHLARHAIFNSSRYEKNTLSSALYEISFEDMVSGATEPRSLKHLCRCRVRECLRKSWSLPDGVFELGLPSVLESYVRNLDSI